VISIISSSYGLPLPDFPCLTFNRVVYYFVHNEIKLLDSSHSTTNKPGAEALEDAEEGAPLLAYP